MRKMKGKPIPVTTPKTTTVTDYIQPKLIAADIKSQAKFKLQKTYKKMANK